MKSRITSLAWWNTKNEREKQILSEYWYNQEKLVHGNFHNLTGREIEIIYLSEHPETIKDEDKEIEELEKDLWNQQTGMPPIKEQSNSVVSIQNASLLKYPVVDGLKNIDLDIVHEQKRDAFIEGANWQKEQYSSLLSSYRELLDEISTNWDANDEGSTSNKLIKKGNAILSQFNQ